MFAARQTATQKPSGTLEWAMSSSLVVVWTVCPPGYNVLKELMLFSLWYRGLFCQMFGCYEQCCPSICIIWLFYGGLVNLLLSQSVFFSCPPPQKKPTVWEVLSNRLTRLPEWCIHVQSRRMEKWHPSQTLPCFVVSYAKTLLTCEKYWGIL